jgi:TonB family protein
MRSFTGRRVGQSDRELAAAVSFSLFLHLIIFLAALYLSFHVSARVTVPLFYRVNLVNLPADVPLTAPAAPAAAAAPKAPEPKPKAPPAKAKQPAVRAVPKAEPVSKSSMPALGVEKRKPEKAVEAPAPSPSPAAPAGGTAGKKEAVAVSVATGGTAFPFPPYVAIVRDMVERNWNPPPGGKGLKARVSFRVLRSGRVGDVKLDQASGNFYFDQAAMRAILASSPFPQLPPSFFKDDENFSVDLMERE